MHAMQMYKESTHAKKSWDPLKEGTELNWIRTNWAELNWTEDRVLDAFMHCNLRVISPGERENALPFTQQQHHRERGEGRGRGTMHWHLLTGKVSFILMCSTLTTCKWLPVCGAFQLCRFSFGFSFRKIACRCKCSACVCECVSRVCSNY